MADEPLSDERLAEIEMLAKSDAYASKADILGVDELIAEIRRLRGIELSRRHNGPLVRCATSTSGTTWETWGD
jgi:hypothetical protein